MLTLLNCKEGQPRYISPNQTKNKTHCNSTVEVSNIHLYKFQKLMCTYVRWAILHVNLLLFDQKVINFDWNNSTISVKLKFRSKRVYFWPICCAFFFWVLLLFEFDGLCWIIYSIEHYLLQIKQKLLNIFCYFFYQNKIKEFC